MTRRRSWRALAALAALALGLAPALAAPEAQAATGDSVSSWAATYTVSPSGLVDVVEKIAYTFASPSSTHGIERGIVTREPYTPDDGLDRVYEVSNIVVSADPTVSSRFSTYTATTTVNGSSSARNEKLVVRIGDPNRTVGVRSATYTLSYTIKGALITSSNGDELYWDAIPIDAPPTSKAEVTVNVPAGPPVQTHCYVGAKGSTTPCDTDPPAAGKSGTFASANVGGGRGMTVSWIFPAGSVSTPTPLLVQNADKARQSGALASGIAFLGATIASIVGVLWWRRARGRDERYLGLPPGLVPAPGQPGNVGNDTKPEIPVQFTPPRISVGEAGLLIDNSVDVRDTTATLVDLAVRGGLTLNTAVDGGDLSATLQNPGVATLPHEVDLIETLFGGAGPGTTVDLSTRGTMTDGHNRVRADLLDAVGRAGWYVRLPSPMSAGANGRSVALVVMAGVFLAPMVFGGLVSALTGSWALALVPLVPVVVGLVVVAVLRVHGKRSAMGRALTDQVEGFRTYLATAEADQLRFEEGEDIFSRYLPWAIMFGLTERWTKTCQRLVELGRIPDTQPTWYYGPWQGYAFFNPYVFDSGLAQAATPAPTVSSSDSGFGSGGSSFGGGFSGGGGGGGSLGGW